MKSGPEKAAAEQVLKDIGDQIRQHDLSSRLQWPTCATNETLFKPTYELYSS
jgi:hypothetical protein